MLNIKTIALFILGAITIAIVAKWLWNRRGKEGYKGAITTPPERVPVPSQPSRPSLKQILKGPKLNHYRLGEEYYSQAISDQDQPNLSKSLEHFKKAFEEDHILEAGLGMAKIYHYCNVPQIGVPNKQVAKALYNQLILQSTNPDVKQEANARLFEINQEERQRRVNEGPEIRREPPPQVVLEQVEIQLPQTIREIPRPIMNQLPRIQGDSQNVHDTSVVKHFKHSFQHLKRNRQYNQHNKENPKVIDDIKAEIPQNRLKALRALDFINKTNASVSSLDQAREKDVLNLVWDRINHPQNQHRRQDLINSLIFQLEDFYPSDAPNTGPICAQGRVARVLQTLEGIDANPELVQTKPMWAVRDEINTIAANIRTQILDEATPEEQDAYNQDQDGSTDITKRIKGEIAKKIKEEYVNSGLYEDKEIKPILEPVMEAI